MSTPRLVQVIIFRGDAVRPELRQVVATVAAPLVVLERNCCTLRDGEGEYIATVCWTPQFNARRVTP